MSKEYNQSVFYSHLVKGNLSDALKYLKQFIELKELYNKYISIFELEQYVNFQYDNYLNEILIIYQRYYRDVFYLNIDEKIASENMRKRFISFFGISGNNIELGDIEENEISHAFKNRSYYYLGGKTGGYFGPYIWKTTEVKKYNVELPDGTQEYTVKFLDDFISKSWLDYISFGDIGTGGWIDDDGIINCIKSSYNLDDENFNVSLLKHEARHTIDKLIYKDISSTDLEYRAKLVELIYSNKRNLLVQFALEADNSKKDNSHSSASYRIVEEFMNNVNCDSLDTISIEEIQLIAKELFMQSNNEMKAKYIPQ